MEGKKIKIKKEGKDSVNTKEPANMKDQVEEMEEVLKKTDSKFYEGVRKQKHFLDDNAKQFNAMEYSVKILLNQESIIETEYLKLKTQQEQLDQCITNVINDKDRTNEYNRILSVIHPLTKGLSSLSATFEDFKGDLAEIKFTAAAAGLSTDTNPESNKVKNKFEKKIDKIKDEILFQDRVLEQIEMMEKLERLLVEVENLATQHQNQKVLQQEVAETQSMEDAIVQQQNLEHESYLIHAKLKLKQFVKILEKVNVYDPTEAKNSRDDYKEDCSDDEDKTYSLDQNYMVDLTTRFNKLNQQVLQFEF